MTRASFPEIPRAALKSHATPERVERVWRRLELDASRAPRPGRAAYWWAPALGAGLFGLGVLVGARVTAPVVEVSAVAEPRSALPTPGAGRAAPRQPPAAEHHPEEEPAPKHARRARAQQAEVFEERRYAETYGEPAGMAPSEAAPPSVAAPAEWERLAEAGDFRAARAELDRSGGFQSAAGRASASQLMVLADIARASGNREQAAQALKRVLSSYVSAPEAPIAAWTLGNLLEQAGDGAGAADAYATYRRLSPAGDFAEDAAARQVDVALSQGNLEIAARAVEEYAANFPKGRRLAELRKRLAALAAPANVAGGGTEPEEDEEATEPGAEAPPGPPAPVREP